MREILFRAKRLDNGEWVEGHLASCDLICSGYPEETTNATGEYYGQTPYVGFIEIDPETVCQFTGLTDKNGVKIFEGDIVKSYQFGEFYGEGAVRLEEFLMGWYYENYKCMCPLETYEVIGNIFDNPELMKGGEADEK